MDGPGICPGEKACEKFAGSRGTQAEKEEKICRKCPAFPSKFSPEKFKRNETRLNEIINRAIELRQKRDSGFGFYPSIEPAAIARTILLLDENTATFERILKLEYREMLGLIVKKPGF
ncbi:MAG: hypothetical protein WA584_23340 [Pyrinomonadaceae bacterium]